MEIWSEIRREVLTGGFSKRAAIAKYGIGWHTLKKMLAHDEPPGYRHANQRPKPKLQPFLPVIRQILEADGKAPPKQKHTARRIFERLPKECTETLMEGHRRAFEEFGGVPKRTSSDNSAIAVIEVLKGRERKLTREFLRLQSHYLFREHFRLVFRV